MHRLNTSFVLGFHGCRRATAERLVQGSLFEPSRNDYDWLGEGVYFWLSDPARALDFAREKFLREKIDEEPAVVGAVIDLGLCLDLSTRDGVQQMAYAFQSFRRAAETAGVELPENQGGDDLLRRYLDCAVINYLHEARATTRVPEIDTVLGVFIEGRPAFPGAGFREKTHVQIAVRTMQNIKGVFWPR